MKKSLLDQILDHMAAGNTFIKVHYIRADKEQGDGGLHLIKLSETPKLINLSLVTDITPDKTSRHGLVFLENQTSYKLTSIIGSIETVWINNNECILARDYETTRKQVKLINSKKNVTE